MSTKNLTAADAYARIARAQIGSAVDATPAYLAALRHELLRWAREIESSLCGAWDAAAPSDEDRVQRTLGHDQ